MQLKERIGQRKSIEKNKSVIFLWGGVSNWLRPVVFFLSLERNISNFCDEKRDDRHVLVAEYSRMPARLSLVQLIGRDVIAAVTCETSLQKQRLGAVVVVISRQRRKDEAGEKEQTSREDGPVTLQEDTEEPRHLPWACPGVKTRTWTSGLWNVKTTFGYI